MKRVDDNIMWAFVSGDLDTESNREIEHLLQSDADLRARYLEMKDIVDGVGHWSKTITQSRVENVIRREKGRMRLKRIFGVLLILLSLVLTMVILSGETKAPEPDIEQLYATHFSTMDLPGLQRNNDEGRKEDFISIAYVLGDFDKVVEYDRVGLEKELPPMAQLAMAISLMKSSKYGRAEDHLEYLKASNTLLKDHVMWYSILLVMAKEGVVDVGKLERMAQDPQNDRQDDARNLLKALE